MDASDRIAEEFNRPLAMDSDGVVTRRLAERIVCYVVIARCEIDFGGFRSLYEQGLEPEELEVLIDGLRTIGEVELAAEFQRGFELLESDGFHSHRNLDDIASCVKLEIDAIGERLWDLDEKLSALLDEDNNAAAEPAG